MTNPRVLAAYASVAHLAVLSLEEMRALPSPAEYDSGIYFLWAGDHLITRKCGGRYTSEGFRALWQRTIDAYCRRGGSRFTFHDIRALCATKCASPEEAMKLLGHTNISMTLKVYRRGVERVSALRIERPSPAIAA